MTQARSRCEKEVMVVIKEGLIVVIIKEALVVVVIKEGLGCGCKGGPWLWL